METTGIIGRYIIINGEAGNILFSTDNLNDAIFFANRYNDELSGSDWDNCMNAYILDTVTDEVVWES